MTQPVNSASAGLAVSPRVAAIDTNCTGCNARTIHGAPIIRFWANLPDGLRARVFWSLAGGDPKAGPGTINATGEYTPPSYLTEDTASVDVTARLISHPAVTATAHIALNAGFLQPLTPENVVLGAGSTVSVSGRLAQAGGRADIHFALSDTPTGSAGGIGTLSPPVCQHDRQSFTTCTMKYTAPEKLSAAQKTYLVARNGASVTATEILLDTSGINSNPVAHQLLQPSVMLLGSSGGNNRDFDAKGSSIADCCSGTLGALIQDTSGRQYVLGNNHVLARSDAGAVGDPIIQPGLIDNNCTPNGEGPGTLPVASLSDWLPLSAADTNVDAAIAQVGSRTVDNRGTILELGARKADGTLGAAPPGISSTAGKGENPSLSMHVAKSGRTTGLTCGDVSAIDVDIAVDYFKDCAETRPYLTKHFTNQIAVSGERFSDAGDSGALLVDSANAEPVGLYFAGGTDGAGVGQGLASPVRDVLTELGTRPGKGTDYSFVGGADHPVSCLSYGNETVAMAQSISLSNAEIARGQQALSAARALVNPVVGILGVAMGKSTDRRGEAAVLVYVNDKLDAPVPSTVNGVRTMVIPASAESVAMGTSALANFNLSMPLSTASLSHAREVKQRRARALLQRNPSMFGVGVGQSLDDPREAALVIYVDRIHLPAHLPATIDGVRTRYIVMDRLHVTRSFSPGVAANNQCRPPAHQGF